MTRIRSLVVWALSALVLLCGATCGCGSAQARPKQRFVMKTVDPSGQDLEILSARISLDLDRTGKLTRTEERQQKILTERAVDDFGDPRVHHDAAAQRLQVAHAITIMRDGKKVETQKNGINETLPAALEKAPAYTNRRETVVTYVGLERLATTELSFTVSDQVARPYPLHLELPVAFEGPAKEYQIKVAVPAKVTISYQCLRCTATADERTVAGKKVITFRFQSLAAFHDEAGGHGHAMALGMPRLVLSDAASWAVLGTSFGAELDAAIAGAEQTRAKALELTRGAPTLAEKVEVLVGFVGDGIAPVDYAMTELGWRANPADEVLARGYGHVLDRAVLLAALLGAIGVEAEPVLVARDRSFAEEVPSLAQFSEVWIRATVDGQERWLSPGGVVAGDGRAWIGGRHGFAPKRGVPFVIAAPPPSTNLIALTAELTLADDLSVKGKASLTAAGTANPYAGLRAADQGPDKLAASLAGALIAGATVTTTTLRSFDDRRTSFEAAVAAPPQSWQSDRFLALPIADGPGFLPDAVAELARDQRTTPLVLPSTVTQRSQITWHLPAGMKVRSLPKEVAVANPVGSFKATVTRDGDTIVVTRELVLTDSWITPEHYPELRALCFAARAGRVLLVERDLPE